MKSKSIRPLAPLSLPSDPAIPLFEEAPARSKFLAVLLALVPVAVGTAAESLPPAGVSAPPSLALKGEWKSGTLRGHQEYAASLYSTSTQSTAVWRPNLQSASPVRVAFYLVTKPGNTSAAQVEITGGASPLTARLDLAAGEPRWETLGVVQFQGRGEEQITLSNISKGVLRLSAVRLEILDPADPAMVWQTLILDDTIPTSLKESIVPAITFADVPDPMVQLAAGALVADGLLAVPAKDAFAPEKPMARAEFLAALRKLAGETWVPSAAEESASALSISEAYALTLAAARATAKNLSWASLSSAAPELPQWVVALGLAETLPLTDEILRRGESAVLLRRWQQEIVHSGPRAGTGEWELAFQDEFTGDKLDPSVWEVANYASKRLLGGRWKENCVVENGLFRLVTKKENRGGKEWSSGMAGTKVFRQKYGYWEARFRYAGASGLNNAFWTIPGKKTDKSFEIDFNEGHWPNTVNMSLHQETGSLSKSWRASQDLSKDFHTYAALWNEKEVIYYWDGEELDRKPNFGANFESPVIFSTAVFTWAGPVTAALDGKSMDVDWVRIYRPKSTPPSAAAEIPSNEPTNAAEAASRQSAIDAEVESKYQLIISKLPAAEQAWERVLQDHLGAFYLPHHKRAKVAGRSTASDFVADDPALPRILLIGDSVSMGYTVDTRRALAGRANVHRAPANCGPTAKGLKELDAWLGDGKWDVIHFNFGIHDRATPITDYTQRLEQIVARLKRTGARLIWASTTPISDSPDGQQTADSIVLRNQAAAEVMQKHDISSNDLFAVVTPHVAEVQRPNDVHFYPKGHEILGQAVADAILKAQQ